MPCAVGAVEQIQCEMWVLIDSLSQKFSVSSESPHLLSNVTLDFLPHHTQSTMF